MIKIIRQWIMDLLGFSSAEANGTLVLVLMIIAVAIVPRFLLYQKGAEPPRLIQDSLVTQAYLEFLEKKKMKEIEKGSQMSNRPAVTFHFDPNEADEEDLLRLGFSPTAVKNLVSYRDHGGYFYKKEDLEKIYGISGDRLQELDDFITITARSEPGGKEAKRPEKSEVPRKAIELNVCTATDLQRIPGIGEVLSARIIRFRDKLGGFYSKDQLYEVYGLDSTVVTALTAQSTVDHPTRTVNLNSDSIKYLAAHPYISWKLARAIYNYRLQHGDYRSAEELRSIKIVSDSIYQKLYPYLFVTPQKSDNIE